MRRAGILVVGLSACSFVRDFDGLSDRYSDFCATHSADNDICETFETKGPAKLDLRAEGDGRVTVDQGTLHATLGPAEVDLVADAEHVGRAGAQRARLGADITIAKYNEASASAAQVAKVWFVGETRYEIGIGIRGRAAGAYVFEYSFTGGYRELAEVALPRAGWHRIELAAALDRATVDVDIDGTRVVSAQRLTPAITLGTSAFGVGIAYANAGHDGWDVRVDNVTFDGQ
jgi:hypothetical protein